MVRIQMYLTEEERDGLEAVAKSANRKQSEIIREAVDRSDLPDATETRRSWGRG